MNEILDDVRQASEALLAQGAADPGCVWRNPTLVTAGTRGVAQARTVVLRAFDAQRRVVDIHSDTRSAKFEELTAQPQASLHGWDSTRQIQLRLTGRATLHTAGAKADAAWAALRPQSRATYHVQPGPGTIITEPDHTTQGSEAEARDVFCVISLAYDTLEYLHLARERHRRARFTWRSNVPTSEWLVP